VGALLEALQVQREYQGECGDGELLHRVLPAVACHAVVLVVVLQHLPPRESVCERVILFNTESRVVLQTSQYTFRGLQYVYSAWRVLHSCFSLGTDCIRITHHTHTHLLIHSDTFRM